MTDLERELRTLLEADAREAPPPHEPRGAVRRTRRRQVGTVLVGAVVAVAVVAGGIAGLRTISTDLTPAATELVSGTVNGITVTYPSGWYLVDPVAAGLEPTPSAELPRLVLALSRDDLSRPRAFGCPGLAGIGRDGLVMTVQQQPLALRGDAALSWPTFLEPTGVDASESACYPGWDFYRAVWTAGGRTFEARLGIASDASQTDRAALFDAFDSMTFALASGAPEAALLDVGTAAGEAWELIASSDASGLVLTLQWSGGATGSGGFTVPAEGDLALNSHVFGSGNDAQVVVFGATSTHVAYVEVLSANGSVPVRVDVLDVPDLLDGKRDAFVAVVDARFPLTVWAFDADGRVIAKELIPGSGPGAPESKGPAA